MEASNSTFLSPFLVLFILENGEGGTTSYLRDNFFLTMEPSEISFFRGNRLFCFWPVGKDIRKVNTNVVIFIIERNDVLKIIILLNN